MYGPPSRTVADVFRAVKRQFGDESGAQLEDGDIYMWINDSLDEIVKRNRILKTTATSDSVVGQAEYDFPDSNILQIESLHYGGFLLKNVPFPVAEQSVIADEAGTATGEPAIWYEWAGKFYLWPTPLTVKPIKLFYTKKPDHVSSLSDVLPVSDKYYASVVQYVLKQAYEMDDDLEASQFKSTQFYEGVNFLAEEERTAQNMTYNTIMVVD